MWTMTKISIMFHRLCIEVSLEEAKDDIEEYEGSQF